MIKSFRHVESVAERQQRGQLRDGVTLVKGTGPTPRKLAGMQDNFELWKAKQTVNLDEVEKSSLEPHNRWRRTFIPQAAPAP